MIFFYTRYDYTLGQKRITGVLKNKELPEQLDLYMVTPGIKYFGLPVGGGFVKMSRLYNANGDLIPVTDYSPEIKETVKAFKSSVSIPYFQLWKGYLSLLVIALVGAVIYAIKTGQDGKQYKNDIQNMTTALQQIHAGQLYGVTFFTDAEGNSIEGLPAGWIRVNKVDADTLFIQRSVATARSKVIFKMDDIASIKPETDSDWNPKIEKINYSSLKKSLQEEGKKRFDLLYIGSDYENYRGVIMSINAAE
ncbi:hypothetical protein ACL9RF_01100 [Sphingobacterium sp. Mn56C]|uniref:hypothetical protein n=1 Tax=Sphingobacterium sp. Mn56C TaxID=3395261 RepID=UPI003BBFBF52